MYRFAVFSYGRRLEQQRASANLGEESMDLVGVIAFRKTHYEAITAYYKTLNAMVSLWRVLHKEKVLETTSRSIYAHNSILRTH